MRTLISLMVLFGTTLIHAQQTVNTSIVHDSEERNYTIYIPSSYTGEEAVPLVFNLHGYGSNALEQMFYGDFRSIADTANFILVHPQGTLLNGVSHWNVGGWTVGSTVDDVSFFSALLDSLIIDYSIDESRVYSTGMSNGGYMSFKLACELSDRIAAVASVTGSMTPQITAQCNPSHPTPIMQIHGTADATVPYAGDPLWTLSINNVLQFWYGYNNCNSSPTTTPLPNINTVDGSTVEQITYSGGDNGSSVEHFKVNGGGHDWPGAWGNMDISASREAWLFFEQLCDTPVHIEKYNPSEDRKLIRIVDLLGRATEFEKGAVLFYQYSDGSVEKKLVMD